ncbi:hypothetical protein S245_051358, partial [Arachis hypogaea]
LPSSSHKISFTQFVVRRRRKQFMVRRRCVSTLLAGWVVAACPLSAQWSLMLLSWPSLLLHSSPWAVVLSPLSPRAWVVAALAGDASPRRLWVVMLLANSTITTSTLATMSKLLIYRSSM